MSFIEVSSGVRERSVPLIMGQVLSLVAAALGICALTTWLGRDLAYGTARIFSFVGLGMLIAQTFVPALRRGSLGILWLGLIASAVGFAMSKDTVRWMKPLSYIVRAAVIVSIGSMIFGGLGSLSPIVSVVILVVSALLILVDFNYVRKHATEDDVMWLATGIFVSIINIFISLLSLFGNR